MFRNYAITALRNLVRNRLYAAINIIGLAVGFAAAILIALFVRDEFSYDRFFPDHEHVYLLGFTSQTPPTIKADSSPAELAAMLKFDFPIINSIARLVGTSGTLGHGGKEGMEAGVWADANIFEMFKFPVVAGSLDGALARPDSIVLTRSLARKYFGRDDPIGETIEMSRQTPMTVTAVVEDLPSNTHLKLSYLAAAGSPLSLQTRIAEHPPTDRDFTTPSFTYLKLPSAAAAEQVREGLPAFFRRHKGPVLDNGMDVTLTLRPITALHLAPGDQTMKPRGSVTAIAAFSAIGVMIILAASINFVNLVTARATRRAVEVGVRKVTGAQRRQLMTQFLGESVLYVAFGMILAAGLAAILLPTLNTFLDRTMTFGLLKDVPAFVVAVGFGLVIAMLAGAYPALILTAFHPATVLKGGALQRSHSGHVREILVVLQFAILIGLLIATGVDVRQNRYALNEARRLNSDQVILVGSKCEGGFRDALKTLPGVRGTACSSDLPFGMGNWVDPVEKADGTSVQIPQQGVGFGFFEFYGLHPLAGRFFEEGRPGDAMKDDPDVVPMHAPVVMNEAAVKALGYGSPETAVGKTTRLTLTDNGPRGDLSEIIGVVPDFAADAVHNVVPPTVYFVSPRNFDVLSVRLDGRHIPETLDAIGKLWNEQGEIPSVGPPIRQSFHSQFLDQVVASYYADLTRQGQLFGVFAAIAIFIAALGLLGMSGALAENRTKEIGIRKAMGASKTDILRLLLWQFTKPVLWANMIAWPVGYFVMRRWLEGFAYHIDLELWIFLAASALALVIALLTVAGHALLVARAKPVAALRYE